jgi:ABC-type transporter Mla MlaB component
LAQIIKTQQGLQLSGDFVFSQVTTLLEEAKESLNAQAESQLTLFCGEITRIDSAGISLFLELKRWCETHNKKLTFKDLPSQAQSLINTYKLQYLIA